MRSLFTALLFIALTGSTAAGDDIAVDNAWIREAPPGASMMAAYLVINNLSDRDIELVGVDSPAFAHVMMHKSETVDGVARMMHQDSLVIPAHGSLALEPGSFHLMMPAPETRLTQGDKVDLLLHFADERSLQVTAVVRKKP
jgi:copper(I)-binding protein